MMGKIQAKSVLPEGSLHRRKQQHWGEYSPLITTFSFVTATHKSGNISVEKVYIQDDMTLVENLHFYNHTLKGRILYLS